MKRFLSILLVAVLIVTSMVTVAFAADGSATASVSKSQTVEAGDTVTLTVTVSGNFSNYEMKVTADDGLVNSDDASLIDEYVVNDGEMNVFFCTIRTDVNGDGVINTDDASLIREYAVGNIDVFPAENK